MMMNLFSIFDPSNSLLNLNINWMSIMLIMLFMPMMFWIIPSRIMMLWNEMINMLYNELKMLINNKMNSTNLMFISLLLIIMFSNLVGLFPYIFTSTSHLVTSLSLALPIWMSMMLFGWINKSNHMFIHLVPQGTPSMLMSFMVLIESISNFIRPWTLSIRLTANMIAGHLLMTLMGNMGSSLMSYLILIMLMIQSLLIILEMAVAIIQSYVFTVLSSLYFSEIN